MKEQDIQRLLDEGKIHYPKCFDDCEPEYIEKAQDNWRQGEGGQRAVLRFHMQELQEAVFKLVEPILKALLPVAEWLDKHVLPGKGSK